MIPDVKDLDCATLLRDTYMEINIEAQGQLYPFFSNQSFGIRSGFVRANGGSCLERN